jgi:nucleoside-diphosphate-sugar epimerase
MITGATGFVGYHTAKALLASGHELSLLVRSVGKMNSLFGRGQIAAHTVGDITDREAVAAAMAGCDAVVHSAAMVSTDANDAENVFRTNVEGTRTVIGLAVEQGVGTAIHVSSVTALFDPGARVLDENSPPGTATNAYGRSKVACERYVRELQQAGYPVYITYPASVIGPDDPGLTEALVGVQTFLKAVVPLMPGGNQYVDVRDVARIHTRLLEERPAGRRYTLGGHYLKWTRHAPLLEDLTGRRLVKLPVSGAFMRLTGRVFDQVRRYVPNDLPISAEAMSYATQWVVMDNSRVQSDLDFSFRPLRKSMADTIRWLHSAGHITPRQAGKLADNG